VRLTVLLHRIPDFERWSQISAPEDFLVAAAGTRKIIEAHLSETMRLILFYPDSFFPASAAVFGVGFSG
jgi:hypothetical protein